jgi:RNA polymerase primary sigma factor
MRKKKVEHLNSKTAAKGKTAASKSHSPAQAASARPKRNTHSRKKSMPAAKATPTGGKTKKKITPPATEPETAATTSPAAGPAAAAAAAATAVPAARKARNGQIPLTRPSSKDDPLDQMQHPLDALKNQSNQELPDKVKELVRLAQEQGYLTYTDINDALPDHFFSAEDLDDVYTKLRNLEIEIVDQAEVERLFAEPFGQVVVATVMTHRFPPTLWYDLARQNGGGQRGFRSSRSSGPGLLVFEIVYTDSCQSHDGGRFVGIRMTGRI